MIETFKKLYSEGGVPRFYRGLLPALVQVRDTRLWVLIAVSVVGGPRFVVRLRPAACAGAGAS